MLAIVATKSATTLPGGKGGRCSDDWTKSHNFFWRDAISKVALQAEAKDDLGLDYCDVHRPRNLSDAHPRSHLGKPNMDRILSPSGSNNPFALKPVEECPLRVEQKPLHRVAAVRQSQEMSIGSAAKRLGWSKQRTKASEEATFDLTISELLQWQAVLGVPLQDLLVEPEQTLSRPVMERARLLRMMKTTRTLSEVVDSSWAKRLIHRLAEQLIEIMPELRDTRAWPNKRQTRGREYGVIAERTFSHPG